MEKGCQTFGEARESGERGKPVQDARLGESANGCEQPLARRKFARSTHHNLLDGAKNIPALAIIPPAQGDLIAVAKGQAHAVAFDLLGNNLVKIENLAVQMEYVHK
jgi:hypothetical protein